MKTLCGLLMGMFALSLSAQQPPAQQQMTVADLRDFCGARDAVSKSACRFYILGVTQGVGLAAGEASDRKHFCIPEGLSADDTVTVVTRAMTRMVAAFPKDLGKPAVSLVGAALMQAYPCGR